MSMEICPSCNLEISSKNANTHLPLFNLGKLSDGKRLCAKCFTTLNKRNSTLATNTKKYTYEQIDEILKSDANKKNSVEEQLLSIGINSKSTFWGRKELKELPNILSENEKIKGMIIGTYNGGSGILVATDYRLIFIDKGFLYGLKTEDFGYDKITSVQFESGIINSTVKIMASGNEAKIEYVEKSSGRDFADLVRRILAQPKNNTVTIEDKPDIISQIEKLAKLKENGILSEEEFNEQKKKLLEKL